MPKQFHKNLKKQAKKKFPKNEERQDKYVYGTLNKLKIKKKRTK